MTPEWVSVRRNEVEDILARYPEKKSAILPLLHLAQESRGFLVEEDFAAIGELIGRTAAYVESTASFYVMFRRRPQGQYVITVCEGLSCALRGCDRLTKTLQELLGLHVGETSSDGLVTLETTHECLAACEGAPCLQVNHEYYLNVDDEKARKLVESIRRAAAEGKAGDMEALELKPEPAPPPMEPAGRDR